MTHIWVEICVSSSFPFQKLEYAVHKSEHIRNIDCIFKMHFPFFKHYSWCCKELKGKRRDSGGFEVNIDEKQLQELTMSILAASSDQTIRKCLHVMNMVLLN